jgi:hypothetical protein
MLWFAWRGGKLSATTATGRGATTQEARDARAIEGDLKRYRQLTTLAVSQQMQEQVLATVSTVLDPPDSSL